MKGDIKNYLDKYRVKWTETNELKKFLPELNVIYQTRVQKERFKDNVELYDQVIKTSEALKIKEDCLPLMKKEAIIMHPLPRVDEIAYGVDNNSHAFYFQQAQNGLYVRMALLKMILVGY